MARSRYGDLLVANRIRKKQETQSPYGTSERRYGRLENTTSRRPYGITEVTSSRPTTLYMARIRKRKRTR